jgi:hypothetical protein
MGYCNPPEGNTTVKALRQSAIDHNETKRIDTSLKKCDLVKELKKHDVKMPIHAKSKNHRGKGKKAKVKITKGIGKGHKTVGQRV